MNKKLSDIARKIGRTIFNLVYWLCIGIIFLIFTQIFLFSSYKIPSDSMGPNLIKGDNILVFKPIPGARLFDIFALLKGKQVNIFRLPGIKKIQRNDIVVFNFPYPNNWNKTEMDIMIYYVKRCVALPGDTFRINNGIYQVNGIDDYPLGNVTAQKMISKRGKESFEKGIYHTFPFDSIIQWNIKDFGPLYVPKAGDVIMMNRTNYCLYKKLIEWEQHNSLRYKDSSVWLSDQIITTYRFKENYFFMAGDRPENSKDSRYWGLLPEAYIAGKACMIWKSVDPYTGRFRWNRFLKGIR
ncbi:MAG: signal peptidase I [Mangrovibacterium sp.]